MSSPIMRNRGVSTALVAVLVAIVQTTLLITLVSTQSTTTESSAVVANDGQDNFLILRANEISDNPQLLSFLQTASKAEIEEIVENSELVKNKILERTKVAVEARERNKQTQVTKGEAGDQSVLSSAEPTKSVPLGMPLETPTKASYDESDDDDDDDEDNYHAINKLILPKITGDVKKGAVKVFKISKALKVKLKELLKKPKKKGGKKKAGQPVAVWPMFRYKVTTN